MADDLRADLPTSGDRQGPMGADPIATRRWRQHLASATQAPWLHSEVASRMAQRLTIMRQPASTALLWPHAPGGGASQVHAVWPRCRCHAVDDSGLTAPTQPPGAWWRRWLDAWRGYASSVNANGAAAPGSVEMVWSNLYVHTHPNPQALMAQWLSALQVGGYLMFSTWGTGSLPQLRQIYAEHGFGPPMASWVDMHDWGDLLVHAGFADPVMDQEMVTLTFSTPEAALAELRALGGNTHPGRHAGFRGRRWRERLLQALHQTGAQRPDGRVCLGFEVVYGHAFKPQPRMAVAVETRVDVEQLRQAARQARTTRPPPTT